MTPVVDMQVERWEGMCRVIVGEYFAPAGMEHADLMQEARLGAFEGLRDYQADRDVRLSTFVALCVRRKVITAIKTATRGKHSPLNQAARVLPDLDGGQVDAVDVLPARDTPPQVLERREYLHDLGVHIRERLTLVECQCLLGLLNDESYEEIAERHDLATKTVDNAIQRVRRKLASHVGPSRCRHHCPRCGGPTRKRPGRGRPPKCVVCRVREAREA